jgi:cyanophycinase
MIGGGDDLDEAFRWLCKQANGGDFLVLRARGGNDYNPYVNLRRCSARSLFSAVMLVRGLLENPRLHAVLTDSHFAQRDRMGRSLGFLARIMQDAWSSTPREIAIDEGSAVLVEGDGKASVVGPGKGAYFLRPTEAPETCRPSTPLTFRNISAYRAPAGARFDASKWRGEGGASYSLSVEEGVIHSTQTGGVY